MKEIKLRIIRKNKYGNRWIEEPIERIAFRDKCKYQRLGCLCDKHYYCYIPDNNPSGTAILNGCTPNVICPRMKRWDTVHGLTRPYTWVDNPKAELELMQLRKEEE